MENAAKKRPATAATCEVLQPHGGKGGILGDQTKCLDDEQMHKNAETAHGKEKEKEELEEEQDEALWVGPAPRARARYLGFAFDLLIYLFLLFPAG
jgi:hypothetical protein